MTTRTISRLTFLALLLFGALPVHAQSQSDQGNKTMEHSQIQLTTDANNAAVAAGDMDAILVTFEPDAVMVAQPGISVTGTDALREAFKQFLGLNPKITIVSQDIIQAGDIALHSYTWNMSGKTPDGKPVEQSGFSTVVLRKQADGRWLMVIDNPFGDSLLRKG
jgi:uncharacterized protein (TIGR02246 family)